MVAALTRVTLATGSGFAVGTTATHGTISFNHAINYMDASDSMQFGTLNFIVATYSSVTRHVMLTTSTGSYTLAAFRNATSTTWMTTWCARGRRYESVQTSLRQTF